MATSQPKGGGAYNVVLLGFDPLFRDPRGRSATERLQEAFGIDLQTARHFVDNTPTVVRRRVTADVAARFERLLVSIGGHVDVVSADEAPQPSSPAPAPRAARMDKERRAERDRATSPPPGSTSQLGSRAASRPSADDGLRFADDEGAIIPPSAPLIEQIGYDSAASALDGSGEIRLADEVNVPAANTRDMFGRTKDPKLEERQRFLEQCPRCNFEQPRGNEECARCGVVFAKVEKDDTGEGPLPPRPIEPPGARYGALDLERPGTPARPASSAAPPGARPAPAMIPTPGRPGALREGEGPSFWASIPRALLIPFWGKGALWQVILVGVLLLTGCLAAFPAGIFSLIAGMIGTFAYFGLLGRYFSVAAQAGVEGEFRAPDLPWGGDFGDLKSDIILPGIAYCVLAALLFITPTCLVGSAVADDLEAKQALAGQWKYVKDGQIVASEDEPRLIDTEQRPLDLDAIQDRTEARTVEHERVLVVPSTRHIVYYDDQNLALDIPDTPTSTEPSLPWWAILAWLVPVLLWPMCLTVSMVDGSLWSLFNPFKIIPALFKGGLHYLVVVAIGVAALAVCSFGGVLLASFGSLLPGVAKAGPLILANLMGVASMGYATGVQAWLMGRMAATRPQAFSHL